MLFPLPRCLSEEGRPAKIHPIHRLFFPPLGRRMNPGHEDEKERIAVSPSSGECLPGKVPFRRPWTGAATAAAPAAGAAPRIDEKIGALAGVFPKGTANGAAEGVVSAAWGRTRETLAPAIDDQGKSKPPPQERAEQRIAPPPPLFRR